MIGVEIFIILLDYWGYHWTEYGRCKEPEYYTCEMQDYQVDMLDKALELDKPYINNKNNYHEKKEASNNEC